MKHRLWTAGLSAIASLLLVPASATVALAQSSQQADQDKSASAEHKPLSAPRSAIKWSREKLAEMDGTIAVLEQDASNARAEARPKAQAALDSLRQTRDAYRADMQHAAGQAETWSDSQVASAQRSLDTRWRAFETQRDTYLSATQADIATRRAVLDARVQAWEQSIEALRRDAARLNASARGDIDTRIAALQSQIDEAKATNARLQDASTKSWDLVKKNSAKANQLFRDTYVSIRKSIAEALEADEHEEKKEER
ncbi:hypothetical protein FIL70_04170 [Sphingobium fuliginis ATCC 27551]|nr:hypothetical protein FIL70_04170 [Sphingobium fuliginis ATCC 27551]